VITIDGFLWFVGALLACGAHALYLRGWRRERRQQQVWWQQYEAQAQARHEEFMSAIDCLDDNGETNAVVDPQPRQGSDDQVIRELVAAAMGGGLTEAMVDFAAYLDRLLRQFPDGGRALTEVHARCLIAFDPVTRQVITDFDARAKRRAEEMLPTTGSAPLRATRATAFCLGYKAGVVDLNLERGKQPLPAASVVYCVEKQPLSGSPAPQTCGAWEVIDAFASEASAQDCCERIRRAYGEQPAVVRVTEKVVKA